jgi:hypothetical protein
VPSISAATLSLQPAFYPDVLFIKKHGMALELHRFIVVAALARLDVCVRVAIST